MLLAERLTSMVIPLQVQTYQSGRVTSPVSYRPFQVSTLLQYSYLPNFFQVLGVRNHLRIIISHQPNTGFEIAARLKWLHQNSLDLLISYRNVNNSQCN